MKERQARPECIGVSDVTICYFKQVRVAQQLLTPEGGVTPEDAFIAAAKVAR